MTAMTISDTERREVARRLREYSGGRKAFHLGRLCAACGIDKSRLMSRTTDADAEAWAHLADLIDPSEPKVKCVAEVKIDGEQLEKLAHDAAVEIFGKMRHSTKEEADAYDAMLKSKSVEIHPVDRDALLALADEMDRDGRVQRERQKAGEQWLIDGLDVMEYARRIREALRVVE